MIATDIEQPDRPLYVVTVDAGIAGFVEAIPDENDIGVAFYESIGFGRIETTHNDHFGVQQYEYRKRL